MPDPKSDPAEDLLLLPEHPACAGTGCAPDAFGLGDRLGRLRDALRDKKTRTPLAVALTGDWGTGKTSAMHWLKEELTPTHDAAAGTVGFVTCFFKPWKHHSRETVLNGLLAEVLIGLEAGDSFVDKLKGSLSSMGSFAANLVTGIGLLGITVEGDAAKAQEAAEQAYQAKAHPELAYLSHYEKALADTIKEKLGNKRLAVFIDDLDRCLPEVAIQVLEAIKLFFDQSQVVFVLGVDRDVVDRMMVRHYTEALKPATPAEHAHVARKARQYLDKMFQVEVQVPPTDRQVAEFARAQVTRLQGWGALSEEHQQRIEVALGYVAGINPRGVVRALNTAFVSAGLLPKQIAAADDKGKPPLQAALAQAVQLRLVEAVLSGAEVAALGPPGDPSPQDGPHTGAPAPSAEWHNLARREEGRRFLRDWSLAVQDGGPLYLTPSQIEAALSPGTAEAGEGGAKPRKRGGRAGGFPVEGGPGAGEASPGPGGGAEKPDPLAPLLEVARKHPGFAPLLQSVTLGAVLRIVEFPPEPEAAAAEGEDADLLRLAAVVARKRQTVVEEVDLEALKAAKVLDLSGTDATDEELERLAKLGSLTWLDLSGTQVTGAGLAHLAGLGSLERLDLEGTQVTDAGLAHLAGLGSLQYLFLHDTQVTDAGLADLAKLTSLQELGLSGTQVTDAGLAHLAGLESLRKLFLVGTQVTDAGVAKFHAERERRGLRRCIVAGVGG